MVPALWKINIRNVGQVRHEVCNHNGRFTDYNRLIMMGVPYAQKTANIRQALLFLEILKILPRHRKVTQAEIMQSLKLCGYKMILKNFSESCVKCANAKLSELNVINEVSHMDTVR